MTKYAVMRAKFEFNPKEVKSISEAFSKYNGDANPEQISLHDELEDAQAEAKKLRVNTDVFSEKLAAAQVVYIEEVEYEEDEDTGDLEYVCGGDYWDIRGEEIHEEAILDKLHEKDYDHRIDVMTVEEAKGDWWKDQVDNFLAHNDDMTWDDVTEEDIFGEELPDGGYVLYALPPNGDGKYFIYDNSLDTYFLRRVVENALAHTYGEDYDD